MKLPKKLTNIFIIFILLFQLVSPIVFALDSTSTNYLALGDSIGYGYGLADRDTESYAQIVRSKLNIPKNNFKNLAVSGMTCGEFYQKIQTSEYTSSIRAADMITVSIGSNELLGIAIEGISSVTGVDSNDPDFTNKVQQVFQNADTFKKLALAKNLYTFFTSNETKAKIEASIAAYEESWSKSISYIKSINSNVFIIATEFYNPYYEVGLASYDLGNFVDEYIKKMNVILKNSSQSESLYRIAKIYDDFNTTNPRITNVNVDFTNFSKMNVDPHPNKNGHSIIASKIMDVIKTSFVQQKKDLKNLSFSKISDVTYTGKALTPKIQIKDGKTTLTENTDYTLTYINNTEVGEASIVIKGIGNYTGSVTKNFNIVAPQVTEKKNIDTLSFSSISDQTFLGFKITPDVTIKDNNYTLKKGTDYSLTYHNNINIGTASVDVKGIGNYTGTKKITFKIIAKDISNTTISDIQSYKYTGNEIKPPVNITDGSSKLVENKDYTISYANNISVGTASVLIKGIGNYSGSISKTFQILETEPAIVTKDINTLTISDITDKIYTGKVITPEIKIFDDSNLLVKGVDYTLSYYNNLEIGTATLQIKGIGNYRGTVNKTFNIVKKDINFTQISDISEQVYTGNKIEPEVIITSDSIKLIEGQDYTVEYENSTNVGTATIKITGINNYTGSTIKSFEIISNSSDDTGNNTINTNGTNQSGQNTNISTNINTNIRDNTTSLNELPYTGIKIFAFILLITITSICIYSYKKYHLNRDI